MTKTRTIDKLLGGSALIALILLSPATGALAASKSKKTVAPSRIEMLEQQVEMLKAELTAMKSQMSQTAQTASDADEAAKAAQVKALAAQGRANTAANDAKGFGDVAKNVAWASDTKIGGKMYFDFTNVKNATNGVNRTGNGNGTNLDVKRFYLSVDHKFDSVFSANLTTDFQYSSAISSTELYVKKAYLQAKLDDALWIRAGSSDLPWVPFVEDLYGYRYVENVDIDRTKFGTSADWGVHAGGKFADGLVGYQVSVINGAGYKTLTRSKNVDVEGRIDVHPIKELTLAVGGYTGKLGKGVEGTATPNTAQRVTALIAYSTKLFRVGGQYFYAKNWNNVTTVAQDKADGWSLWGSVTPIDNISLFARYDWVKPNKDTNPSFKDHYYNVGVSYTPTKNVDLALLYKRDKADNGAFSTSNGTIGGAIDGTYDEVGVWGQFKF